MFIKNFARVFPWNTITTWIALYPHWVQVGLSIFLMLNEELYTGGEFVENFEYYICLLIYRGNFHLHTNSSLISIS